MMKNIIEPSIEKLFNLAGKTAIVTGGANGIGKAISFRLAEAGADIIVSDINLEKANETVNEINKNGGKAKAIKADVTSLADITKIVEDTLIEFGSIDILVNNAGIYPMSPFLEMTEENWDKVINVNLKGTFMYSQAIAKKMKRKGGKIINIASIAGIHPRRNMVHFVSSKGRVIMLTKAMARELALLNFTVNAVAPGYIATGTLQNLVKTMIAPDITQEQITSALEARIPMGRMGKADDVAKIVLFLASGLSGYMTGETIVVDGGFLLSLLILE